MSRSNSRETRRTPKDGTPGPWHWRWAGGVLVVVVLLGAVCATPVVDSDLWFHLAYARQMLSTGSLVSDHTAFSWTPADNAVIYCAWIAQLLLLGLHALGGLTAIFAFRYAVFAAVLGSWLGFAWRLRVLTHPITALAATLALLMSTGAVFIKPQLGSFALMTAVVLLCAWIQRQGGTAGRWVFAIPVLMVVWVNTHGGFVVGLLYLFAFAAGEQLNAWLAPSQALSPTVRRGLFLAVALSVAALFLTPYWARYPLQFFSVELPAIDLKAVRDYDSIFAATQRPLHFVEYGAAALLLLAAAWTPRLTRAEVDWRLVVTNVVFGGLYAYYVRLTFFWAPVLFVTVVTLLADRRGWLWPATTARARALGVATLAGTVALSAFAIRSQAATPVVGSWMGFGNGYWNPEEEADYLAEHFPVERLGNDYNSGGYLMWRLGPRSKVFMDARYFPYRSWFQEYLTLESGAGIESVLKKYPTDVWCVSLHLPRAVAWFRGSPDWTPAFYGASAAVFVRRGTALPGGRLQSGERLGDIRNLYQAIVVLAYAFDVRDLEGAERVVRGMEARFAGPMERPIVAGARTALDGLAAHGRGDHGTAVRLLSQIADAYKGAPAAALAESAIAESARLWQAGDDGAALQMAMAATRAAPQAPVALYNAGAIGWWTSRSGANAPAWRPQLEAFTRIAAPQGQALAAAVDAAIRMLNGQTAVRPFVLTPR
ncbi:MAG: hypothetical protein R2745_09740 [Vicinamibacterales bacterium]